MFCRLKNATFATVLVLAAVSLSACSSYIPHAFEAKGIPVKTLKPSAEDVAAAEKVRQEQERQIAAMASVTGNSSFTERRGTPEYLLGPGDVLKITFWEGAKGTESIVEVRSDGKISYAFMDDVPVSGRTMGEVYEALMRGAQDTTSGPRGSRSSSRNTRAKRSFCSARSTRSPPGRPGRGNMP